MRSSTSQDLSESVAPEPLSERKPPWVQHPLSGAMDSPIGLPRLLSEEELASLYKHVGVTKRLIARHRRTTGRYFLFWGRPAGLRSINPLSMWI